MINMTTVNRKFHINRTLAQKTAYFIDRFIIMFDEIFNVSSDNN